MHACRLDIVRLIALHEFLNTSFKGSSVNGLEFDEVVISLGKVIQDATDLDDGLLTHVTPWHHLNISGRVSAIKSWCAASRALAQEKNVCAEGGRKCRSCEKDE